MCRSADTRQVKISPSFTAPEFETDPAESAKPIAIINATVLRPLARYFIPSMIVKGWGYLVTAVPRFVGILREAIARHGSPKAALDECSAILTKEFYRTGATVSVLSGPMAAPCSISHTCAGALDPNNVRVLVRRLRSDKIQ